MNFDNDTPSPYEICMCGMEMADDGSFTALQDDDSKLHHYTVYLRKDDPNHAENGQFDIALDIDCNDFASANSNFRELERLYPAAAHNVYSMPRDTGQKTIQQRALEHVNNAESDYSVTVLWGSDPEAGDMGVTYKFDSAMEQLGFETGIDAANGWFDHELVDEGYVHSIDEGDE